MNQAIVSQTPSKTRNITNIPHSQTFTNKTNKTELVGQFGLSPFIGTVTLEGQFVVGLRYGGFQLPSIVKIGYSIQQMPYLGEALIKDKEIDLGLVNYARQNILEVTRPRSF